MGKKTCRGTKGTLALYITASDAGRMSPSLSVLRITVGPFRVSYTTTIRNYGNNQGKEGGSSRKGC